MSTARSLHTARLLANGQVLVTGGFGDPDFPGLSTELYDPATRTWTRADDMHINRESNTASVLPSGKVLIAGGIDIVFNVLNSTELYTPITGKV